MANKLIQLHENTQFINEMAEEWGISGNYKVAYEADEEDIWESELFPGEHVMVTCDADTEEWKLEVDDVVITAKYPSSMRIIAERLGYTF